MAQNYIGRLTAMLTARDAGFTETLAKARAKVAAFGNEANAQQKKVAASSTAMMTKTASLSGFIGNNLASLAGGLSIMGAAYTTISNVGAALERMGKSADDAAKLGMQDMPEFLAGLQYRAKLVGVEAGTVSDSLGKLFRTIAEARAGSKSDQDILATLGLSAASLAGQSPDKVVLQIADALEQVADSGERARLAVALFGKSGANMVNVLRGGSGGIAASVAEAKDLGVARSAKDLAVADAAGDAIDKARLAIEGFWNELTVRIAPAIEALANYATGLISIIGKNTTALESVGEALVYVSATGATIVDGLRRIGALAGAGNVAGHAYGMAKDLYNMRFDNAYPDGISMFAEAGRRSIGRIKEAFATAFSTEMPGAKIIAEFEKAKAKADEINASTNKVAEVARVTFEDYVGPGLRAAAAKVDEYLKSQQEIAKAARDKYWYDKEAARLAKIAKNEADARSVAELITSDIMSEQEDLVRQTEERARRLQELMSSPMGGAPLIMAGSAEARLAMFNNVNANVQAVGERQLTVQERIDRELKKISDREANIERLFKQVLERIPVVNPL